jgi:membrane associated rhomboid family serine protease
MELLILSNSAGTYASVEVVRSAYGTIPSGMTGKVIGPGETYCGIPYAEWREHVGSGITLPPAPRPSQPKAVTVEPGSDWREEPPLEAYPGLRSSYGYFTGTESVHCTLEKLVARCVSAPATPGAWTPDSGGVVRPEEVPELVSALAEHRLRSARRSLAWCAAGLAVSLAIYIAFLPRWGFRSLLVLVPGFLAIGVIDALHRLRQARRGDAPSFAAVRAWVRHAAWVNAQPAIYTKGLLAVLILVFVAQTFGRDEVSIEMAGLVKPAVWQGEWWRLLTACLLHANFTHLWMNGGALLAVGRLLEAHSRRAAVPLVFLVSGLAGSVFSLLLYPNVTSVGASGGLMGLTGYLLVMGFRRRDALPEGFRAAVGLGVAATAALGVVGFAVIDNAAHLGGLVAGVLIAHMLEGRDWFDRISPRGERWMGLVAMALIAGVCVMAISRMYGPTAEARREELQQERFREYRLMRDSIAAAERAAAPAQGR